MTQVIEVTVLFVAALATGGLLVNWIGLGRAMARLSASAYIEFHQHTNQTFNPYMPIVVIGSLAGGVGLAVMYGMRSVPGQLAGAGAACYSLVLIIALLTDVRINHQIASWSIQNPPRDWSEVRARWIKFHILRTLFAVPAFAVYVLAVMSHTNRSL